MLAQLGTIVFSGLKSFQTFVEKFGIALAEQDRINIKPGLQMVGINLEDLSIDIQLHNAFCDVPTELTALKNALNTGEILPLVMGDGTVVADFVISDMTAETVQTTPVGTPLIVNVSLTLKEYFDTDPAGTEQNAAADAGAAIASPTLKPLTIPSPVPTSGAGAAANAIADAKVATDDVDSGVSNWQTFTDQAAYWQQRVTDGLQNATDKLAQAQGYINDIAAQVATAQDVLDGIMSVQNYISVFQANIPPTDFDQLNNLNAGLQGSVLNLKIASGGLNALAVTRQL